MSKTNNTPWPGILASTFFNASEKKTFESMCAKYKITGMLNESMLSRMRSGLDKLRQDGNADMDEMMIDKLQEVMMSASNFAGYLNQHFDKTYDKVLGFYKTGLDKAKIELKRKLSTGKFDYPQDNLEQEIKDLTALSMFWLKDFKQILQDQTTSKYAKCLIAESMNNSADVVLVLKKFNHATLNESENYWSFLDSARDAISSTQPFASILEVADLSQNVGNSSLNKFAEISNKIGAPQCTKLTGLGTLAGKLAELKETQVTAEGIMKTDPILRFLPTGRALIEAFELIAYVTTVLELVSELKNEK